MLEDPSSGVRILSGGRDLVLQGVARNSSGNYTCSAFNLEGNDTSNTLPLRVKCECKLCMNSNCNAKSWTCSASMILNHTVC